MKAHSLKLLLAIAVTVAGVGSATIASSGTCSNSCVTMAIPRTDDGGVHTKLDGTADAVLWPPGHELRKIRISALNDRGASCDVTIHDVRQDETPGTTASGTPIDDAVGCSNDGHESSVYLRSDRADNGDGRSYHIRFNLSDPDCSAPAKADEVLVLVPREETAATTSLQPPADDESTLTASYAGPSLECGLQKDDRLARHTGH